VKRLKSFSLMAILFLSGAAAAAQAKDCNGTLAEWTEKSARQKVVFLESYAHTDGVVYVKALEGSRLYGRMTEADMNACPGCLKYVYALVAYLMKETPPPEHFTLSNRKMNYGDELIANVLIDSHNRPLGGDIYMIREFKEIEDPSNKQTYWVNGFFDQKGKFLGRGSHSNRTLTWRFY
jgi:hypothetical protein